LTKKRNVYKTKTLISDIKTETAQVSRRLSRPRINRKNSKVS